MRPHARRGTHPSPPLGAGGLGEGSEGGYVWHRPGSRAAPSPFRRSLYVANAQRRTARMREGCARTHEGCARAFRKHEGRRTKRCRERLERDSLPYRLRNILTLERERETRVHMHMPHAGPPLCICRVGSRSVRVWGGCRAPTPHRRSRAAEAGALNRRLTQVCGARARRKRRSRPKRQSPTSTVAHEGSQVAS